MMNLLMKKFVKVLSQRIIITIIVMLILVTISIRLVATGGLFEHAGNAVGKTKNEINKEKQLAGINIDIDKYINQTDCSHVWGEDGICTLCGEAKQVTVQETTANTIATATDKTKYYGKTVTGYTSTSATEGTKVGTVGWKIFYAGPTPGTTTNNIYLIADASIHYDNAPTSATETLNKGNSDYNFHFNNIISDYSTGAAAITDIKVKPWLSYLNTYPTNTNNNMKAVAFMLDTSRWNMYYKGDVAEYAIGGPTLDMFVASYNEYYEDDTTFTGTKAICYARTSDGYAVGNAWTGETDTSVSNLGTGNGLYTQSYLASPSAFGGHYLVVYEGGTLSYEAGWREPDPFVSTSVYGSSLRPVVCLKSDVVLTETADGFAISQ